MGSKRDLKKTLAAAARREPPAEMLAPTDEQLRHCEFMRGQVRDEGLLVGFAYRRRPLIESMAVQMKLSTTTMAALRYYRAAADRVEASPTKSCLDVGVGGGGGNGTESRMLAAAEANAGAKQRLARCEAAIGAVLPTMRGVVLADRSFSDIAMERYGTRKQDWLEDEVVNADTGEIRKVFREKLVPRDHSRKLVAEEFREGARRLVAMLTGYREGEGTVASQVPVRDPRSTEPVATPIFAAVLRALGADLPVAGVWMAPGTRADLAREARVDAEEMVNFAGVPVLLRDDWVWGWRLCLAMGTKPLEEACGPPAQMA